jgi:hypothetical protein
MSILNSFVNQIGRELGHDAYKVAKTSVISAMSKTQVVDRNSKLLLDIESFKFSKYDKISVDRYKEIMDNTLGMVNPKSFLFDDVYLSFISLTEKVQPYFSKYNLDIDEVSAETTKYFNEGIPTHVEWLKSIVEDQTAQLNVAQNNLDNLKSKSKLVKLLVTPFGLSAAYGEVLSSKKLSSFFGVLWFLLSITCIAVNAKSNLVGGVVCASFFQSWLFIANSWLRTKPSEYLTIVESLTSNIKCLNSQIKIWEKI